jgi:hypothetical protein
MPGKAFSVKEGMLVRQPSQCQKSLLCWTMWSNRPYWLFSMVPHWLDVKVMTEMLLMLEDYVQKRSEENFWWAMMVKAQQV